MFLIVGINCGEKRYTCFDVHYNSTGYVEIDFDTVRQNYIRYFIFHFEKVTEINPEFVITRLKSISNSFDIDKDKKKARLLHYFMSSSREALFPVNIETSIPLINLMWIAEDKRHFPIALKCIENKLGKEVFSPVYELAAASGQSFTHLKSLLIRYAMTGILKEDGLKNLIDKIFDTDELMIERIKNILSDIG
jgi:hypothetical protein